MKLALAALFATATIALGTPCAAQGPKPLFASADPLQLVLRAPIKGLIGNRDKDSPASGTLTDPAGHALPVSVSLRGLTRRTADICDFPPLRVTFTAPPPAASPFAGQRSLKLVTHCRNSGGHQQHVLLEYAAYRMFNVLTPKSFRARLATIAYQDEGGRPIVSRVGFFIEDLKDVAARNGTAEVRAGERIPVAFLSPPDAARGGLFMHMIGNHDWSMRAGPPGDDCCHNFKLIGALGPVSTIPVPYDFDYSGLVDAPYAVPPDSLGLADVKQRLYRGYCIHNAEAMGAARQMREARPQLLAALNVPGLSGATLKRATAYLDRFFADIATDSSLGSKVLNRCVG